MSKNRKERRKKKVTTLADTHSVHLLRELYRTAKHDRPQMLIRLGEAFDRKFGDRTCTRSEQLFRVYPLLAFMLIYAFFKEHGRRISKKSDVRRCMLGLCFVSLFEYLMKYETSAVNESVITLVDDDQTHRKPKNLQRQVADITFPPDVIINNDSVLTPRASWVCSSFTWFGRCDHEHEVPSGGTRRCGGRHICIEPECRNRRTHATLNCAHHSLSMIPSARKRVKRNISYALKQRRGGAKTETEKDKIIKELKAKLNNKKK